MGTRYCYKCMEPIEDELCPRCGFSVRQYKAQMHQLKAETLLRDRYYVGKVLGEGGFGITYVGWDTYFNEKVAIKEFYMNGYVFRDNEHSDAVRSSGSNGALFEKNRERFLLEARTLARFREETGIVNVRDFFKENNTAYIVMDFLDGITLRDYVKQNGKLSGEQMVTMLEPIFHALEHVHAQSLIHRDISPDNIMLTKDGKIKLLDFGAAREVSQDDTRSLSVILKHGYAPEEQYRRRGHQGPWTDVYALCATMYRCITGIVPDDAMERMYKDKVRPPAELDCDCSKVISDAIMQGMGIYQDNRYRSIQALYEGLKPAQKPPVNEPREQPAQEPLMKEQEVPPQLDIRQNEAESPSELEQLQKQAEAGDAAAQNKLALCYYNGDGVEKNFDLAFHWFQKAAEQGWMAAQYNLATCYKTGRGVKRDPEQAFNWFGKAAQLGHVASQSNLGDCYRLGKGVKKDPILAFAWYQKAAAKGYANAQFRLGDCYRYGAGVEEDPAQAFHWYQKAAEQGNIDALYGLGTCYLDGAGVEKDPDQAFGRFAKAALRGHADAQSALGSCYYEGIGIDRDPALAVKWYRMSANQGNAPAQFNLGCCYANGDGIDKDPAQAFAWFQKAAEQGHVSAQFNLGCCYTNGAGTPEDQKQAFAWFQKAAEQGHAAAQYQVGFLYHVGDGVTRDLLRAMDWYLKALINGNADAVAQYKQVLTDASWLERKVFERNGHSLRNLPKT